MASSAKLRKIDELLKKAGESLDAGAFFEAERLADKALAMARQEQDFQRMSAILEPLAEARKQRTKRALDLGTLTIVQEAIAEDAKIKPGCYLIQPPQVGSDARRLRMAALANDIPLMALCREPLTQTRLVPVVAIGPGSTIRTKVPPPAVAAKPDLVWFIAAIEELGDCAIEVLDPTLPVIRRIDALLDCLNALPEHEKLHHALQDACREAHTLQTAERSAAASKAALKAKIKS